MITVTRTVEVAKPVTAVAGYLSDFTTAAQWDPHTRSCLHLSPGPIQVGARYRNTQQIMGLATTLEYRVTEYTPGRVICLEGAGKNVQAMDRMDFVETLGGSSITYLAQFRFSGVTRLAEPLLRIVLNRVAEDGVQGMRRALDDL